MRASAQDQLQIGGNVLNVKIISSDDTGIKVKKGEAVVQYPWGQIQGIAMPPPAESATAIAAYQAAKADPTKWPAAEAALKKVIETYPRLPTPWMEDATLGLIEANGNTGKIKEAEELLKKFKAWYPRSPRVLNAVASMAQGLITAKRFDDAVALIDKAIGDKRKQLAVTDDEGKALGAAMNAMGACYEAKGDLSKALDSYLATKVLYFHDPATLKVAVEKTDALKPKVAARANK